MDRGPVEWEDRPDDPVGLADDARLDRPLRDHLAAEVVGDAGEVFERGDREIEIELTSVATGLSVLAALELGELIGVRGNDLGHRAKQACAIADRPVSPVGLERASGSPDCLVHLRRPAPAHDRELLARARLDDGEVRAVGPFPPGAIDKRSPRHGRRRDDGDLSPSQASTTALTHQRLRTARAAGSV